MDTFKQYSDNAVKDPRKKNRVKISNVLPSGNRAIVRRERGWVATVKFNIK